MTLPAYPSTIKSDEIWNNFQVATIQTIGLISGTTPNWYLTGLGSGLGTNAYAGYAIRAPEPEGHRVGTVGTYTYSPGGYGPSSWSLTFTMTGAQPPSSTAFASIGTVEASKYDIFPQRSSSNIPTASYRAGAGLVPAGTYGYPNGVKTAIPSSGTISHNNFHGSFRIDTFYVSVLGLVSGAYIFVPKGTWKLFFRAIGGGGGGGGNDAGSVGSLGGVGMSMRVAMIVTSTTDQQFAIYTGGGGFAGPSNSGAPSVTNGGTSYLTDQLSGTYNAIARGGHGGSSGNANTSGSGGGGGGVSALSWQSDATSNASAILLALAGGGGGGTGSGLYSITQTPGTVSNANLTNRYLTFSLSTLNTFEAQYDTFSPYPPGTTAYRRAGYNSDGQGHNTIYNYYPPGTEGYVGGYDGGGGGGGGGGNGYGGGITRAANNSRVWSLVDQSTKANPYAGYAWAPPNEFCGAGGGQGFGYFNISYYTDYATGYSGEYGSGYGAGATAAATDGSAGAAWLKVTNDLTDTTFY